ncbi:Uncharacterized protein dnm_099330 [Desulfonema magnum]|uniref:Uncharacterized protein n=1 Tax=Desulfonema magnum TaxID=45655 RepID=A0A975GU59_9BACT|nr:Uncharacterized protein dnm_099330 [Desulfonema magnum]
MENLRRLAKFQKLRKSESVRCQVSGKIVKLSSFVVVANS